MIINSKTYFEITEYARALCTKNASIIPEDLVNDAYLELHENKSATLQDYKNKIKSLFIKETFYDKQDANIILPRITENTCYACKQTKPVAAFRLYYKKNASVKNGIYNICAECQDERSRVYRKTKKGKEINRITVKKWVLKNKKKWVRYVGERNKRNRLELNDAYCIRNLSYKYSAKYLRENYHIIEEYRQKKLAERARKETPNSYIRSKP